MSMEEALAEAYASAPTDERILETIELHHPSFLDESGQPTAIRVVQAFEDHTLTLENTAPLNPNQPVLFRACPFRFALSGFSENDTPSLQLSISNVSRIVTKYLEQAIAYTTPITVIYRPYLESDTSAPQLDPVISMTLTSVKVGIMDITGNATLSDVHNWPFPTLKYTPEAYPGLVR